ncbi:DsrE family protein [Ectothiorhodospiraceae bacterium WFHF3C12]|nr:DsrE family protein [Ectothiorhodospiraceae bacterium WFHF3C12]
MTEANNQLVIVITHGPDDERSSVGFTVANGGLTNGLEVAIFLTSSAVDIVRKRAADLVHVEPMEPLRTLVDDFIERGGELWACTPCVKARGYEQEDLLDGVVITGASPMHERIREGARTLSF